MQCFLQVFDRNGKPRLKGRSRFKDHIDWLPLLAWSSGASSSGASSNSGANRDGNPRPKEIRFAVYGDDPIAPILMNAAAGRADTSDWAKATLDCFKDSDDQSWYLRMTLLQPVVTSCQIGGLRSDGTSLVQTGLSFAASSIDYRDTDSKVTYFMPDGAIFDPDQEVCRLYDPDDAVSRLQQ